MLNKANLALDQAIAWHLQASAMDESQWDKFIDWLEASPANRAEYDRLAQVDGLVAELQPRQARTPAAFHPASRRRVAPLWGFGAVAALVVALATWSLSPGGSSLQVEQTSAGTTKQIAFAGGTRIDLNGETRLTYEPSSPRQITLESGEALFSVHHSNQPFVVDAGGFRIRDLGTVFNVRVSPASLDLEVSEGQVLFDPGGANLTVNAGERVAVDRPRNLIVKSAMRTSGSWVSGELAFEDSKLSDVVAAMHRRSGIDIRLSEGLSNAPFTGNIRLSGEEQADVAHLASLIGADYRREGGAWVFTARGVPR